MRTGVREMTEEKKTHTFDAMAEDIAKRIEKLGKKIKLAREYCGQETDQSFVEGFGMVTKKLAEMGLLPAEL